jgi:uncharacterized membrane protein
MLSTQLKTFAATFAAFMSLVILFALIKHGEQWVHYITADGLLKAIGLCLCVSVPIAMGMDCLEGK